MIFRFALIWALIVSVFANAPYANDDNFSLGTLIPYEKFVEGNYQEPILQGQLTVTENISPIYIPLKSYQTPIANSYEAPIAKPIPTAPVSYKPAYNPNKGPMAPQYASVPLPSKLPVYKPTIPTLPAPTIGLHYESVNANKRNFYYVPTTNYPAPTPNYPIPYLPAYSAYPAPQASVGYAPPKPILPAPSASTTPPTNKTAEKPAYEATTAAPSTPISNGPPIVKPPPTVKPPTIITVLPKTTAAAASSITPAQPEPKIIDSKPVTASLAKPLPENYAEKPKNLTKTHKFTGYRYINPQNSVDRRSMTFNQANQATTNTRAAAPIYQASGASNVNPYPPANKQSANQYRAVAEPKHPNNYLKSTRNVYPTRYPPSATYPAPISAYPGSTYPTYGPALPPATIYSDGNVAEAVLRGYSINPEENNNKAIVRIFEESANAIYFDLRICDLKKDQYYSIYIHEWGQLTAGCESAGTQYGAKDTYFNPMLGLRTNPVGFLGSFKYTGENLNFQYFSKKLNLKDILGRSIVIHEIKANPLVLPEAIEKNMLNNFSIMMNPLTSPLVTSRRVACGVIGRSNPFSFLKPPNQNCEIEVPVIVEDKPDLTKRNASIVEDKKDETGQSETKNLN